MGKDGACLLGGSISTVAALFSINKLVGLATNALESLSSSAGGDGARRRFGSPVLVPFIAIGADIMGRGGLAGAAVRRNRLRRASAP
jgi:hypothetical protein